MEGATATADAAEGRLARQPAGSSHQSACPPPQVLAVAAAKEGLPALCPRPFLTDSTTKHYLDDAWTRQDSRGN